MLPEQFILQVQQATDIIDLISQSVTIKKRGKDYTGLCPFHQEKTPSFSVSSAKQIFKCFGCGAGGGVFQFVMLQQKCSFPEAVKFLAERAGIRVPTEELPSGDASLGRGELTRLMAFAAEFYRKQLQSPAGAEALQYAHKRQLTDESIARFGLGYSPAAWDALYRAARSAGFGENQLLATGLVIAREGGQGGYDRFRNRLMFPIADVAGKVIAFGGRALASDEKAKYLNSPETSLFDKSSNLYGLSWARPAISAGEQVVVVEGYFDAIMPAQAGVEHVVATLGTALTERHVRMLSRLARDVVLIFDSDKAGSAAADRALELFITQQMNVRVAAVPDGKDPCDYVLAAGGEAFRSLIAGASDALEYVWNKRSAQLNDVTDMVSRRRAVEEFLRLVVNSAAYGAIDPVRKGMLAQRLSHLLRMPGEQLEQEMRRLMRKLPTASAAPAAAAANRSAVPAAVGLQAAQRDILKVLIVAPDEFEHAARHVSAEDFTDPLLGAVAREVWRLGNDGNLSLDALLSIQADATWGQLVTDLASEGERRGNVQATLSGALEMVEQLRNREELQDLRQGDDDALRKLTEKLKRPDPRRRPAVP